MPRYCFALITMSAAVAMPATSVAACWQSESIHAAEVRDFDTMLMVGALRCRASTASYIGRYNQFVIASRGALSQADQGLRNHFRDAVGNVAALTAYDRYVVKVANRYGAGSIDRNCGELGLLVDAAIAEGSTYEGLVAFAERVAVDPLLDDVRCQASVATPETTTDASTAVVAPL